MQNFVTPKVAEFHGIRPIPQYTIPRNSQSVGQFRILYGIYGIKKKHTEFRTSGIPKTPYTQPSQGASYRPVFIASNACWLMHFRIK